MTKKRHFSQRSGGDPNADTFVGEKLQGKKEFSSAKGGGFHTNKRAGGLDVSGGRGGGVLLV